MCTCRRTRTKAAIRRVERVVNKMFTDQGPLRKRRNATQTLVAQSTNPERWDGERKNNYLVLTPTWLAGRKGTGVKTDDTDETGERSIYTVKRTVEWKPKRWYTYTKKNFNGAKIGK